MCKTVRQSNYSCGHQVLTSMGKSKFCLFYPHNAEEFHVTTIAYMGRAQSNLCYECKVRKEAFAKGLRGAEKHEYIRTTYAKSHEARSKQSARDAISTAKKSRKCDLTAEKIAKLNETARAQVKYYVQGKQAQDTNGRAILLKTILQMPDIIDRKVLVELFGSYIVWDKKNGVWKGLPSADRAVLMSIARRAGMSKTLEDGFKAQKPIEVK
ncbi:hypothetical protein F4781DRAFT_185907 [Annulohypoxylon bovei var. microspora]|nr:hypothetical protein F4781DRAFT_185907 [Annulohypoxylon bovei var. microspora]